MESSSGQEGWIRAYTVRRSWLLTKSHQKGFREKVAQWADQLAEWIQGVLPIDPEPVPVRVRPGPDLRPRRR